MLKKIAIILFTFLLSFGCPFYRLTGITCPACGTTRAWLSLFCGDFIKAFEFNPFFLPLTAMFLRIIYLGYKNSSFGKKEFLLWIFTAVSAFIFNVFRVFLQL